MSTDRPDRIVIDDPWADGAVDEAEVAAARARLSSWWRARLDSSHWRRTTVACSRRSNPDQCRRCLFVASCAHRLAEPVHVARTPIPGGTRS